jgi:exopolyphosphatase/pppGpp-phosphohydrolase
VVDVGGGSTEIVVGTQLGGPVWVRSVDLGSLRLTRLALRDDPPGRRRVTWARATVREALADVQPIRPDIAFAVGGSARGLAKLVGRTFPRDELDDVIAALARRRSTKVARANGLEPTRARTLLAGAILLAEASRTLDRPLTLARGGLREGAALALATEGAAVAA